MFREPGILVGMLYSEGEFLEERMAGHREVYEQALKQGNSSAWDQKWEQAIAAYQRALTEFPGDPVATDHLGLAYMESGQLDLAQATYQDAIRAGPQNPIPYEKIAEILERSGKTVESVQLRLSAAELYLANNQRDLAQAGLREALADDAHAPNFQRKRDRVWMRKARRLLRK